MARRRYKFVFTFVLVPLILLSLMALVGGSAVAQGDPTDEPTVVPDPPTPDPPTEVSPDIPTAVMEPPTATPEPPTATPEPPTATPEPPTEVPTEEIPTEVPTEEVIVTPTETAVPEAPVFMVPEPLAVDAGQTLVFDVRVTDDLGAVAVSADVTATLGSVSFVIANPVETAAPFSTVLTITYIAPAEFTGMDGFILTATNSADLVALRSIVITIRGEQPVPTEVAPTEAAPTEEAPPATQELIIDYNPAATEEQIAAMLASINAVEVDRLPQIHAMLIKVPESLREPEVAQAALRRSAQAQLAFGTYVEENTVSQIEWVPNDYYYNLGYQWGLYDYAGTYAYIAWDMSTRRGAGVIVAVLDTGIDLSHPEFAGQLVPGWDFVNDDNSPYDDHNHGTHVSGVIAARTNNGTGIAGMAPLAKIMPVKVCNAGGSCASWFTAAGIIHATDNRANVINMSLRWHTPSSTLEGAVNYALSRNVVVVAAAGNDYDTAYNYPASYPGVISVAAHDVNGTHASFSTYNDRVTVSAPGVDIFSTVAGGYQGGWNGTSMASPHVAGVAALLISARVATTPATVREAIICGAMDAGAAGYDNEYGWGWVQADWAMNWRNNASSCKVSQPNDDFAAATKITRVPFQATQPIHTRSVTAQSTDPFICGYTPYQTLWYSFKAPKSTYYQFSTIGSSYDTVMGIYKGQEGSLSTVWCSDDTFSSAQASFAVGLDAGQTYYIAVASFSGSTNDGVMKFDAREAVTLLNRNVEENSVNLAYGGTWTRTALRGASAGFVNTTTDNSAIALFTFRGTDFWLSRTVGPLQGNFTVEMQRLDTGGVWNFTVDNRAAVTTPNQVVEIGVSGPATWYMVSIRRDAAGPVGEVALDRVVAKDFSLPTTATALAGLVDDRDRRLSFQGGVWYQALSPAAYRGTIVYTTTAGASVNFRARGSAISIYRAIGPGYGDADVFIDGQYYGNMYNTAVATYANVPWSVTGLTNMEHTVRVELNSGTFYFDAAKSAAPAALPARTSNVDNRDARLTYSGYWESRTSQIGAFASTTMYSPRGPGNGGDVTAEFQFDGNWFCVGYVQQPGGGTFNVYLDGVYQGAVNTNGAFRAYYYEWCSGLVNDARHSVEIYHANDSPIELDYVRALRYNTLTPARGLVRETDPAMMYNTSYGTWYLLSGPRSVGGYRAQGGAMTYAITDNARLGFFINGTGFILYTSVGPYQGRWEVWVDGVQQTFESDEYGSGPYIYLYDYRWRPIGFGVPDLGPGIHYVELRARLGSGENWVDFDGIRVLP